MHILCHPLILYITDLSRAIDSSIKDKINDLTGNDEYEFGDLSRLVDSKIKGEVNKFTNSTSYEFGDLTKEIVRRVATGKYTLDDLFMLLKALAMVGASLSPVGKYVMCACPQLNVYACNVCRLLNT